MRYTVEQLRLWDDDPDAFSITVAREPEGYFAVTVRSFVANEGWLTQPAFDRLSRSELRDVLDALLLNDLGAVWPIG